MTGTENWSLIASFSDERLRFRWSFHFFERLQHVQTFEENEDGKKTTFFNVVSMLFQRCNFHRSSKLCVFFVFFLLNNSGELVNGGCRFKFEEFKLWIKVTG